MVSAKGRYVQTGGMTLVPAKRRYAQTGGMALVPDENGIKKPMQMSI